ncbi:uncharacterized protein BYT42DRAFT_552472 [Radiomyces spectabilis]|uniref:uncharacterized protein n=1 Tax=Radiomyces spectabilis TaxID=64574 RepID=UPI00221F3CC4|nr:uncharacterized protein BYT42DRAFT_552472 [Radiomyces spectabilis]KAI8393850.1 hypothetical protein BYT42DRAFT_552472 [Radiomyces spectabilis]
MSNIIESSESKTMNDAIFQQFYQSMCAEPTGFWDEWLQEDPFVEASLQSSPDEIATPLDAFLSPPFGNKEMDLCGLLTAPVFETPAASVKPDPAVVPTAPDLFTDLPAALAALAAAATATNSPVANINASTTASANATAAAQITPIPSSPAHPTSAMVTPMMSPLPQMVGAGTPSNGSSLKRSSPCAEDSVDEAALKRQKNTDAARRSRLKKMMKMEALEKRVAELEQVNASLLLRVAVLDSEKSNLKEKESSHEDRIKTLEAQLAEAHKALAGRNL